MFLLLVVVCVCVCCLSHPCVLCRSCCEFHKKVIRVWLDSNVNDYEDVPQVVIRVFIRLPNLHVGVRDGLDFRTLRVLGQRKPLSLARQSHAARRISEAKGMDVNDLGNEVCRREFTQQLRQVVVQQRLGAVAGDAQRSVATGIYCDSNEFCHVSKHGNPNLLERVCQRCAPRVQLNVRSVIQICARTR